MIPTAVDDFATELAKLEEGLKARNLDAFDRVEFLVSRCDTVLVGLQQQSTLLYQRVTRLEQTANQVSWHRAVVFALHERYGKYRPHVEGGTASLETALRKPQMHPVDELCLIGLLRPQHVISAREIAEVFHEAFGASHIKPANLQNGSIDGGHQEQPLDPRIAGLHKLVFLPWVKAMEGHSPGVYARVVATVVDGRVCQDPQELSTALDGYDLKRAKWTDEELIAEGEKEGPGRRRVAS